MKGRKVKVIAPESDTTWLIEFDDGRVGIQWAGCVYGPESTLEEIVENELLTACQDLLTDPETDWEQTGEWFDDEGGFGLLELNEDGTDFKLAED